MARAGSGVRVMYVDRSATVWYVRTTVEEEEERNTLKDPPAIPAPSGYQRALSVTLQPNHTINTINSNS